VFTWCLLYNNIKYVGNCSFALHVLILVDMSKSMVNDLFQVVGLTASLGVGKSRSDTEAVDHITRVCALLDVRHLSTVEKCKEELRSKVSLNIPTEGYILIHTKRHSKTVIICRYSYSI